MGIFTFVIAAVLSMPKQFITVYLGVVLHESNQGAQACFLAEQQTYTLSHFRHQGQAEQNHQQCGPSCDGRYHDSGNVVYAAADG